MRHAVQGMWAAHVVCCKTARAEWTHQRLRTYHCLMQHKGCWAVQCDVLREACTGAYTSRAVVALMLQLMGPRVLISAFMAFSPLTTPYSVTTSLSCVCREEARHYKNQPVTMTVTQHLSRRLPQTAKTQQEILRGMRLVRNSHLLRGAVTKADAGMQQWLP